MTRRSDPGLADHLRSAWRQKHLVLLGLVVGLALGSIALPKVASPPRYRATARVDVKPLASNLLAPSSNASGTSTPPRQANTTPTSPLQDLNVSRTVIRQLGAKAADLSAVKLVPKEQWPGALADAILPVAVPGSTQVDLSYTDRDPGLAALVIRRYADALVHKRNADDVALTKRALDVMTNRLDSINARIAALSARADQESDPVLRRSPSTATSTQLRLAVDRWHEQTQAIDAARRQLLFLGPRTTVLTLPAVTQANQPIARSVFLLLGLLVGLAAGVGLALLVEAARPKVVTVDDLERATRVEPIGAVPRAGVRSHSRLPIATDPFSPAAEGYRRVAAELQRRGLGDAIKVVAVVSPGQREGRSTMAANLAYALANDDRQVLLISGDLRRPGIEPILHIKRTDGLADLLEGDDRDPVTLLWSATNRLLVMAAGMSTRNPAQLLASLRWTTLMASLREFNWLIVIDTPPAGALADALSLADNADAVVLVARSGTSRVRSLRAFTAGLERAEYPVLGAVLVDTARSMLGGREPYRSVRRRQVAGEPLPEAPALGRGKAAAAQWQYDESEVLGASRSKDESA
jgi:capsular exopolysaccharide synthesis family protein